MPQFSQLRSVLGRVAIPGLMAVIFSLGVLLAPCAAAVEEDQPTAPNQELTVGIGGFAKLGHWVPVRFNYPDGEAPDRATHFRVTVLDGDDTPTSSVGELTKTNSAFQGLVQFGKTYGDASFELLDDQQESLASWRTKILAKGNPFTEFIPSTGRIIACIEPPPTKEDAESGSLMAALGLAFAGGATEDDRVAPLGRLEELPQTALAYESCESLVLVANRTDWFANMPSASIDAIETWVNNGGHLVVAAGAQQASLFQEGGPLQRFAPGKVSGPRQLESSRRLEEFCSSKEPFLARGETLGLLQFDDVSGNVALGQDKAPLIIRSAVGLGEVTFVTFDPTGSLFRQWKAGRRFFQSLMKLRFGDENVQTSNDARRKGSAVRHTGYEDLVGQMKVPLERFTRLRFIPFALIATLIGLYILCIGVGDWFLVSRLLKKHELTWITFPLLAALFCGIALFAASFSRPATIQLNQVELVDIDSIGGHVRCTAWANLYSPQGETVDLSFDMRDVGADRGLQLESSRLSWLGLPGDGLGGMLNRANPGLYRTGYIQQLTPAASGSGDTNIEMQQVELQVSSTRPLFGQWNGKFVDRAPSRLRVTDRLEGTFTNPFDVSLKECRLFHGDFVYVVSGTLPADGDIDVRSDTIEKTVRSYLTRQTVRVDDKNKSQSVAWDSQDINLSRIMQMMMFYHGAGGSSYTGLTHSYHDFIEMTPQCSMDRAILVGRVVDRVSTIHINGRDADELYDSSLSFVRVLLPVEIKTSKRNR